VPELLQVKPALQQQRILSESSPQEQRIQRLRHQILSNKGEKGEYVGHLCIERARIVTKSYKETEGQPMVLRRAKATRRLMEEMPVYILPDELIVGQVASKHRSVEVFPENAVAWLDDELDLIQARPRDRFIVSEKIKKELREEIIPYWRGQTLQDMVEASIPEDTWFARQKAGVFFSQSHERGGIGHVIPNYRRVAEEGLESLISNIDRMLTEIDLSQPDSMQDIQRYQYLQAARISLEGALVFSERYAKEARRMADTESDAERRAELLEIARVCDRVPRLPAQSWREALQAIWFIFIIIQIEMDGLSISFGRFDQYLLHFLEDDLSAEVISLEEAQELLEGFFVKINEPLKLYDNESTTIHAGFPMTPNLVIGGVNRYGDDVTNTLTYMCLEAHEHVHLPSPNLTQRIHRATPNELFVRALEVIRLGGGLPQLCNDDVAASSLMSRGVSLEDARNYAPIACLELGTDTNMAHSCWGAKNGGFYGLPRTVELAMRNGKDPLTGIQVGPQTGDPRTFKTFAEFQEAVVRQDEFFCHHMAIESNIVDYVHATFRPTPFLGSLLDGCLESGKDPSAGGAYYNWSDIQSSSSGSAGDICYAIKHLVFDTKQVTFDTLLKALDADWEGYEDLHRTCMNIPKYGNDNDEVDAINKWRMSVFYDAIYRQKTPRGGTFIPAVIGGCRYIKFGRLMGATPDGRKARENLSDSIAPIAGADLKGLTSVVKSVAKVDHLRLTGGITFNSKLMPGLVEDREGLIKWMWLIKTYFECGGMHVQFNIVSEETLHDAQLHPEKHQDLMVRVSGYSAFFNELSREVQDSIIARTEQQAY